MKISKQWLLDNRTCKNAWTKKQADILGLDFPLKKGWIQLVVNREITEKEKRRFELAKNIKAKSPIEKLMNLYSRLSREEKKQFKEWLNAD